MSAEDKLREIAALNGWSDELLEQVRTLFAVECNVAFDHGRRVEREAWRRQYGIEMHDTQDGQVKAEATHDD